MQELPKKITAYLENSGKDLLDGYIRFLQPKDGDNLRSHLEEKHFWKSDIPFAVTAFGDVFAWNTDGFIQLYKLTDGISPIIMYGDDFFFENISDVDFQKDFFDLDLFKVAKERHGNISANQCYAFVPLPILGGAKDVNSIEIEDMTAYLSFLIETIQ